MTLQTYPQALLVWTEETKSEHYPHEISLGLARLLFHYHDMHLFGRIICSRSVERGSPFTVLTLPILPGDYPECLDLPAYKACFSRDIVAEQGRCVHARMVKLDPDV